MHFFLPASCRTPGFYAAQATSLLKRISHDGHAPEVSLLMLALFVAATMTILPAIFYWQYRQRHWWRLGVGLAVFILMQDYLMRADKGSIGETFFGAMTLFGLCYLPLVALMEGNRRIARKMAGDAHAGIALRGSEWLLIVALVVPAHLLLFVAVNALDILDVRVLQIGSDAVNCLFSFAQAVNLQAYRDVLNMLLAAVPVLLLATMLAAWFRRSRGHHLSTPWQLYFAAVPGVLCGGLLLVSLFARQGQ